MKKPGTRVVLKAAGIALSVLLGAGLAAPYINAGQYGERLRGSIERALGRRVEFRGKVQFSLFSGGFTVEEVFIDEDPSIGVEPIAHMESIVVRPALWPLLGGRFEIASIRLEGATVNLTKSGPAEEWGRWNFASLINRSVMHTTPALHVRNGRINFRFGDLKTVFYLLDTDLDITPPSSPGRGWLLDVTAKAARTDRPAQALGAFELSGRWYVEPERVDLNLDVDRAGLEEITALFEGQTGGIHGAITSHLHLAGPINRIGIVGRMKIEDVYRWDLMPSGSQSWPLDIRGRLDLVSQSVELQSASAANVPLPLWVRFRAIYGRTASRRRSIRRLDRWRDRVFGTRQPARRAGLPPGFARHSRFPTYELRASAGGARPRPHSPCSRPCQHRRWRSGEAGSRLCDGPGRARSRHFNRSHESGRAALPGVSGRRSLARSAPLRRMERHLALPS